MSSTSTAPTGRSRGAMSVRTERRSSMDSGAEASRGRPGRLRRHDQRARTRGPRLAGVLRRLLSRTTPARPRSTDRLRGVQALARRRHAGRPRNPLGSKRGGVREAPPPYGTGKTRAARRSHPTGHDARTRPGAAPDGTRSQPSSTSESARDIAWSLIRTRRRSSARPTGVARSAVSFASRVRSHARSSRSIVRVRCP